MQLVLHDIVFTLSSALDFVGVNEIYHGKRVALMAASVAKTLGWDPNRQLDILYAGMLHDCGVSTTGEHAKLVSELDWKDAQNHCQRGHGYLLDCPLLARYADWVHYHHEYWGGLEAVLPEKSDQLAANLIFLADRVDFLQVKHVGFDGTKDVLLEKTRIMEEIQSHSGELFAPELVEAFVATATKEAFWLSMESNYVGHSVHSYARDSEVVGLEFDDVLSIAGLFSKVIDAKSPFTEDHSRRVAAISRYLASQFDFPQEELEHMEIAGMLHDLGKLRVPDSVLNKKGPLDEAERAHIIRHSFDTVQLLDRLFPNTKISHWAGYHHENISGTGYPYRLSGDELDLGTRIIAVADCFQALVQKRPYRDHLGLEGAMPIIKKMVTSGKLDPNVVDTLISNQDHCYDLANT